MTVSDGLASVVEAEESDCEGQMSKGGPSGLGTVREGEGVKRGSSRDGLKTPASGASRL